MRVYVWQLLILCIPDSTMPPKASLSSRLFHHVLLFLFYPAEVNTQTHMHTYKRSLKEALGVSLLNSWVHICPFCIFQVFFANQLAQCTLFNGFQQPFSCQSWWLSFSYRGTSQSLNSSKSLCGGWLTQKKWESLHFKWVMMCLFLEGTRSLLAYSLEAYVSTFIWTQGARFFQIFFFTNLRLKAYSREKMIENELW